MHKTDNPMLSLTGKPKHRWVACTEAGLYLGDLSAEELAAAIEMYAMAIRGGSKEAEVFPPEMYYKGHRCVYRRSNKPKLEHLKSELPMP